MDAVKGEVGDVEQSSARGGLAEGGEAGPGEFGGKLAGSGPFDAQRDSRAGRLIPGEKFGELDFRENAPAGERGRAEKYQPSNVTQPV
jgi:hypothetical protein